MPSLLQLQRSMPPRPRRDAYSPCTPDTVRLAKEAARLERQEAAKEVLENEQCRRDGVDAVGLLVDRHGARRVASWVRLIAALKGEEL